MVAMSEAQHKLGRLRLSGCTLYTNVEPCPMCSWMVREYSLARVVYSIKSPAMGGYSAFNVLSDARLSRDMPFFFCEPLEVLSGVFVDEAEQVWREWRARSYGN
jgi:tRNA(adenine34) deaminase